MVDFTKYSVPMLYGRSKNLEYKRHVIEISTALLGFLWREGLVVKVPFDDAGGLKMDFIVKLSDLSSEGEELFKKIVPAWLQKIDRGGDRSDVTGLEKELKKIRSK